MKLVKTLLGLLFIPVLLFGLIKPTTAQENKVTIHFFWANGCPHCAKEKVFLQKLTDKYPQILLKDYEVTSNKGNVLLLQKIGEELKADVSGVPFTVIGRDYISGYYNDEITGKEIEDKVSCAIRDGCVDIISSLDQKTDLTSKEENSVIPQSLNIPIFGSISTKNLSLPAFTFVIALLDGFNPCAMWVLLFLISLLLGMHNRLKMFVLGFSFIFASAFVYFLFLSAWLNIFLFLGFIVWIRLAIGLLALGAGGLNLKEYLVNRTGGCKVTGDEKRRHVFEKIKGITQNKQFLVALFGIILLAFAVNLVELVCSAGLPAVYTKVLTMSELPTWQYYLYLLFYIFIFMLDDLIIFITAMVTLHAVGIQSKYARVSHLIGGILMLIIGFLMLFKPELLMFG
jgi:thiol-disulfide isomerase/thioredoxin